MQRIWQAVIIQAFIDLCYKGQSKNRLLHKNNAKAWFFSNSRDFFDVCVMAGYNPAIVRRKAKDIIKGKYLPNPQTETKKWDLI